MPLEIDMYPCKQIFPILDSHVSPSQEMEYYYKYPYLSRKIPSPQSLVDPFAAWSSTKYPITTFNYQTHETSKFLLYKNGF